eukprot:TRINITY_DN23856_c0_g2_i1.p1 TRINITY_DN23856_c0_g2~~TRINITY_DN23856_c0_g2_i1.p1  ORF type:complete len:385 (+),score=138.73 TRINITY_DN23856_c0_g2_i1:52-1206(+)
MKKIACAAVAAALAFQVDAGAIDDKLSADANADEAASKKAHCWCQGLEEALAARGREGESQLRYLESQKEQREAGNKVLRMEISTHKAEAAQHQASLDSGDAQMQKSQEEFEAEVDSHEKAISAVKRAIAKLPADSPARGALDTLHDSFSKNLEDTKTDHEDKFAGLHEQKSKLVDLANKEAAHKSTELEAGEKAELEAATQLKLYGEQRDADYELTYQVKEICSALESEAADRLSLRNDVSIALSHAKVAAAEAASMAAASKVFLATKGGSAKSKSLKDVKAHSQYSPLEEAVSTTNDLAKLMDESSRVEDDLRKILSSTVMTAHLAGSEDGASVKATVEKLGAAAQKNADALPQFFSQVRAAGNKCSLADAKLVDELKMSAK